ncbi:MAG TPA: hypothetical protein VI790_06500 [Candidatus Nanoarchaeia archaeon]|nr:hypothetical protein [Candidatus Nanoarchaeia archaeon]
MPRNQSSLIELLIVCVSVSVCVSVMLLTKPFSNSGIRALVIESEEVLINYLEYKPSVYNESFYFLFNELCFNESFFERNSYLFNESVRVIEALNGNMSFILYINISTGAVIYNKQSEVCLESIKVSDIKLKTPCGTGLIVYGSWHGKAPLKC